MDYKPGSQDAFGESDVFLEFQQFLGQVARVDRSVLVIGERGSGKELAASRIHYLSARWNAPFVTLNCAALSPGLIESELFGHERGSFTGATGQRKGRFEEADEAFWRSIEIAEKLGDKLHLAIVHYTRGKALRAWKQFEKAAAELCKSFIINESLEKRRGMDIVTPVLIKTLLTLGRADEALDYCQRALEIAPTSSHLLKLRDQLSSPKKISHGTIKRVIPNRRRGYLYGFITTDDGDADIYFREGYIGSVCLADLTEGVQVEVVFEHDPIGRRRATNIRLIV